MIENSRKNAEGNTKTTNWYVWLGFLALVVFGGWVLSGVLLIIFFDSWSDRGTFGDMFGAVNALFSGLALGGVIIAIILQKQELGLQRRELELTRQELTRSAEAQETSNSALTRQFEMLQITAELTAISTLMNYHTTPGQGGVAPAQAEQYAGEMREVLERVRRRDVREEVGDKDNKTKQEDN